MPFEVIQEAELVQHVLGVFYRATQVRDRRGDVATQTNHGTGLPESTKDLLSRSSAPSGKRLAMELVVRPEELAQALLRRPPEHTALKFIPRSEWTAEEEEHAEDLELQIKALVHKLTEQKGWFVLKVPGGNPYDPEELLGYGDDGMTRAFRITWEGLKEACRVIPGTPFARLVSLEDDVGKTVYSQAPDWHKQEHKP